MDSFGHSQHIERGYHFDCYNVPGTESGYHLTVLTLSSMAGRRGSKADTPATCANDSADIHRRMEDMQTTLMQKWMR